jgi:hypothetical protein
VGDAVGERVVEIVDVTGGRGERDPREQILAAAANRLRGTLIDARTGAGEPVGEGDAVRRVARRGGTGVRGRRMRGRRIDRAKPS